MDSSPPKRETLAFVISFLRAEGLYAAEEALHRELESRYSKGLVAQDSPAASGCAPGRSPSSGRPAANADAFEFTPASERGHGDLHLSARAGSVDNMEESLSRLPSWDQHFDSSTPATPLAGGSPGLGGVAGSDVEEYEDAEDVGYVREDVRGQDAFMARELDLSDDDASGRGADVYHRALLMRAGQELGAGRESVSSDGHGSSYFSGERHGAAAAAAASEPASSAAGPADDRTVTLMEPVYPSGSLSRAASGAMATGSPGSGVGASVGGDLAAAAAAESPAEAGPGPAADARNSLEPAGEAPASEAHRGAEGGTPAPGPARKLRPKHDVTGGRSPEATSRGLSETPATPVGVSDEDEAFSFPVTPPSEPAAPGAVFSSWASFQSSGRAHKSGMSSGYNTDDDISGGGRSSGCLSPQLPADAHGSGGFFASLPDLRAQPEPPGPQPRPPPAPPTAHLLGGSLGGSLGGTLGGSLRAAVSLVQEDGEACAAAPLLPSSPVGGGLAEPDLAAAIETLPALQVGRAGPVPANATSRQLSERAAAAAASAAAGEDGGAPSSVALHTLNTQVSLRKGGQADMRGAAMRAAAEARGPSEDEEPALDAAGPQPADRAEDASSRAGAQARPERDAPAGSSDGVQAAPPAAAEPAVVYEYDAELIERKYEIMCLKIIHRRRRTGFEETKDFPIRINDLIAGRYQVMDFLGAAAFSKAVQALDIQAGRLVCLKIIKNNKDYFDQSLDEIKLLNYVNAADPLDEHGMLRLYDYFYYKEHLFLVCELLRANLYEFQKYNREAGDPLYFTLPRVQAIARQVLSSLAFLHSLGLIHSDLKPENILIKSYSRCEVKVIDLGSSCFTTDQLSSYVQSRSYRAPEVILGLPYGPGIDVWSLGCILAELLSGYVLFQNDSLATLLARLEGVLGPVPRRLLRAGRFSHRFYTRAGALFERSAQSGRYEILRPKRTSLRCRVPEADAGALAFLHALLTVDPALRPTAEQALAHPWLGHVYPSD
ncbi:hypothetical protein WJX81_003748 [Elliptochloris bilobata]|uniref:Protein kinase domain-containing protein n=1 Tax=Elliptochloris bilobata TaxID=381761 RepID=A0AAW1QKA9_9CHLO